MISKGRLQSLEFEKIKNKLKIDMIVGVWDQVVANDPVVPIAYDDDYKQAMSRMVSMMQADELSDASLDATADVIAMCDGKYTAWQFRRRIVLHGSCESLPKKDLVSNELFFIQRCTETDPKSYQSWYVFVPTQSVLLERCLDPSAVKTFLSTQAHC